eukprot:gene23563-25051_t
MDEGSIPSAATISEDPEALTNAPDNPTIRAITFAFLLQLAVMKELVMFTTDLAYAYLNATYGEDLDPIITQLEPFVSDICGLPRGQKYRVQTTFVAVFVDNTSIFANNADNAKRFVESMKKPFEVKLDDKAESFLGIQFTKLPDG